MRQSHAKAAIDERLLTTYLLVLIGGLIMVYSASSILAESRFGSHGHFVGQQLIWAVLSLVCVWVVSRVDLKRWAVYSAPALLFTIILLALVFTMPARNGSHRWLFIGPFTVQPSELFKYLMVYYLAFSLANPKRNLARLRGLLLPYLPFIGLGLGLILIEPDLGTTVVILAAAMGMFFLAGARIYYLALAIIPPAGLVAILVLAGYKLQRLIDYWAALVEPLNGSYQIRQAALTFGSGGLFGAGLGDGHQKLFFLPYPHTDFILATIGEEIGFIGLGVVLALLMYLLWRGCRIAIRQPDRFSYLLAAGITWMLFINIAVNIGVVTALLPCTGLALPFFSYGGSSLLMSSVAIGVLINLSRRVSP